MPIFTTPLFATAFTTAFTTAPAPRRALLLSLRRWLCVLFLGAAVSVHAVSVHAAPAAADPSKHPAIKHKVSLPPSAQLHYHVQAKKSGVPISGEVLIKWNNRGNRYLLNIETHALMFDKILESSSEGGIDSYGLAPSRFVDKRLRREASTTIFNREHKTIRFTQSAASYPLLGGEQDRASILWQLVAVARGNDKQFTPGSEWLFFVAGGRDAEPWRFKVIGREKIKTGQGEIDAVRVLRAPPPDNPGQRVDIWLAPSSDWYPARVRFAESDGDFIDQTLDSIDKKIAQP